MAAELALLIPIIAILMVFGMPALIIGMVIFGSRQRGYSDAATRNVMAELQNLRQVNASQSDVIRQLQHRLENVESVIASSEYQARQRIAGAMTPGATLPSLSAPASEPQAISRS